MGGILPSESRVPNPAMFDSTQPAHENVFSPPLSPEPALLAARAVRVNRSHLTTTLPRHLVLTFRPFDVLAFPARSPHPGSSPDHPARSIRGGTPRHAKVVSREERLANHRSAPKSSGPASARHGDRRAAWASRVRHERSLPVRDCATQTPPGGIGPFVDTRGTDRLIHVYHDNTAPGEWIRISTATVMERSSRGHRVAVGRVQTALQNPAR
jgi:hypothetical protein